MAPKVLAKATQGLRRYFRTVQRTLALKVPPRSRADSTFSLPELHWDNGEGLGCSTSLPAGIRSYGPFALTTLPAARAGPVLIAGLDEGRPVGETHSGRPRRPVDLEATFSNPPWPDFLINYRVNPSVGSSLAGEQAQVVSNDTLCSVGSRGAALATTRSTSALSAVLTLPSPPLTPHRTGPISVDATSHHSSGRPSHRLVTGFAALAPRSRTPRLLSLTLVPAQHSAALSGPLTS